MSYKVHKFEVNFLPGEEVRVDGEIKGHVIQVSIGLSGTALYQVEWFNQGNLCSGWFHARRLTS